MRWRHHFEGTAHHKAVNNAVTALDWDEAVMGEFDIIIKRGNPH